jgi:hypothetical protein
MDRAHPCTQCGVKDLSAIVESLEREGIVSIAQVEVKLGSLPRKKIPGYPTKLGSSRIEIS